MSEQIEQADESGALLESELSPGKRALIFSFYFLFFVFFLLLFSILKFPEEKLKKQAESLVNQSLMSQGIEIHAARVRLKVGLGLYGSLEKVEIRKTNSMDGSASSPTVIDHILFYPSWIKLMLGYQAGKIEILQGSDKLSVLFSLKADPSGTMPGSIEFECDKLDLGKIRLLNLFANFNVTHGILSGTGNLTGDLSSPQSLSGEIKLELGKWDLPAQSIMGFPIPELKWNDGKFDLLFASSKMVFKQVRIGKKGGSDSLSATLTGDANLARTWSMSQLQAKAVLWFSDAVIKSLSILDAILAAGKQPDGTYNVSITGPVTSPNAVPTGQ